MKPRCRWRIGVDEGLELAPYRLNVSLVENRRVNGKVRQEHIAHLGAIDGHLLESFFSEVDATVLDKVKAADWQLRSLRTRTAFWKDCNAKLQQLSNRLGPDTKRLRMAIHARVPWVMEPERKQLELLEARAEAKLWGDLYKMTGKNIEATERIIERATERLAEERSIALREAREAADAGQRVTRLSKP